MQNPGSLFLHEQIHYPYFSQEVGRVVGYLALNGDAIPNQPSPKISEYLKFLSDPDYFTDALMTSD